MKSTIENNCLKVSIDGYSEPQLVPKLLLQVSVRELHNVMVSHLEEGGLKEARDSENNIIISDYKLQSILPPQLNNIYALYKVMCGFDLYIYTKIIHSSLLPWRDCYLIKLNDPSKNSQNIRSGENSNRLFETYKKSVMPHGHHIYATAADMAMATMCAYPTSQHVLPQCKCVLRCCYNLPFIDLTYQ